MSKPTNPLSKYRSYSYYHVLAICNSSEAASELAASTELDAWQHPMGADYKIGNDSILGKYAPKKIDTAGGSGQYCILINGSTDAAFTITKANWSSFTASSATMNDRGTSIALEGALSISEPRGIMFLDQVVRCCLELGVDSAGAFWVFKTFFIGYTFDVDGDTDGIDYISDVPPVIFLAYDVVGTFGVAGGEYEINFVAAANSAARLPHFSKASKALNFKAKDSFDNTLTALQGEVNKNYKHYFNCVKKQIEQIKGSESLSESLREVNYVITCGAPYKGNTEYIVEDQAVQLKDLPDCPHPANVHVSAGVSIEDAIHRIIGMCSKIKEEADVGIDNIKYTTKIHSWVTSTGKDSNLIYTVGYRVDRQVQPHSMSFEGASSGASAASFGKNLIEYDYLYTGKNIDILEFDIKMNMGMVYLQGMTISNPYKQPNQQVSIAGTTVSGIDIQTRQHGQNIPVFFGTNIKTASIRDTQDTKQESQFSYSMTKHASLESIEATVKITGNPSLLGSINATADPHFVSERVVQPLQDDGFAKFSEWTLSPAFAKINIKMPRNNDDASLFTGKQTSSDNTSGSNDYATDFWFSGYYFIYGIDHVFDNGEFYQNLQALGIPEKEAFKKQKNESAARDVVIEQRVKECYDNDIGCGSKTGVGTSSSGGVVPEENESTTTDRAKIQHHVFVNDPNLSNIKGYDKASDEVKQAIHNAAVNNPPIKEEDLALTIAYESGFRPGIVNKQGYKGLGQFGDSTWKEFGHGSPLDPNANADATAKYMLHNRRIFQSNVSSQEPTVVDLYTMHQQGSTGGARILKRHYNGTGDVPGSSGLSDKNIKANRLPPRASANDVYNSFEKSLGSRKKTGPTLATTKKTPPAPPLLPSPKQTGNTTPTGPSPGKVTETVSQDKPKAKDALAAHTNCRDEEKKKEDPAKSTTCPKLPDSKEDTTTTTTANKTVTGQSKQKVADQTLVKNTTGETSTKQQAAEIPDPNNTENFKKFLNTLPGGSVLPPSTPFLP